MYPRLYPRFVFAARFLGSIGPGNGGAVQQASGEVMPPPAPWFAAEWPNAVDPVPNRFSVRGQPVLHLPGRHAAVLCSRPFGVVHSHPVLDAWHRHRHRLGNSSTARLCSSFAVGRCDRCCCSRGATHGEQPGLCSDRSFALLLRLCISPGRSGTVRCKVQNATIRQVKTGGYTPPSKTRARKNLTPRSV